MPLHDCVQSLFKKTALLSMKYGLFNCLILMMVHYSPITGYYHPLSGQIYYHSMIKGILGDSLTFHHHLGSFSSPKETTTRCPKSSWAHPHLVLHLLGKHRLQNSLDTLHPILSISDDLEKQFSLGEILAG